MGWQEDLAKLLGWPTRRDARMPASGLPMGLAGAPLATLARPMKEGLGAIANLAGVTGQMARGEQVPRSTVEEAAIKGTLGMADVGTMLPTGVAGPSAGMFMGWQARNRPGGHVKEAWRHDIPGTAGRPAWELDDSTAAWNPEVTKALRNKYASQGGMDVKMEDALIHPELFGNYPQLGQMRLKIGDERTLPHLRGANAYFQPFVATPGVGNDVPGYVALHTRRMLNDPDQGITSVGHELQHGVANVEGFHAGASPDYIGERAKTAIRNKLATLDPKSDEYKRLLGMYDRYALDPDLRSDINMRLYGRDPGEALARNTADRWGWSPEMRAAVPPNQSLYPYEASELLNLPTPGRRGAQTRPIPELPFDRMPRADFTVGANRKSTPLYRPEALPDPANSRLTQVATTGGSYDKAINQLRAAGVQGPIIDYGAGRGLSSAKHGLESFEPYPSGWNPTYRDPSAIPDQSYEGLVNLNVLNVLPPALRQEAVRNMGRIIRPGGAGIIGTRGADVMSAKGVPGGEPMSLIIGQGDQARYQKGFTQSELMRYLQEHLGDAYALEPSKIAKAGAFIRRTR